MATTGRNAGPLESRIRRVAAPGHYRVPVFCLLLTGAERNFPKMMRLSHAESEAPRRPGDAIFADRLSPIAYSYAP